MPLRHLRSSCRRAKGGAFCANWPEPLNQPFTQRSRGATSIRKDARVEFWSKSITTAKGHLHLSLSNWNSHGLRASGIRIGRFRDIMAKSKWWSAIMIIEMRTYTLKPGTIAAAEERFGEA